MSWDWEMVDPCLRVPGSVQRPHTPRMVSCLSSSITTAVLKYMSSTAPQSGMRATRDTAASKQLILLNYDTKHPKHLLEVRTSHITTGYSTILSVVQLLCCTVSHYTPFSTTILLSSVIVHLYFAYEYSYNCRQVCCLYNMYNSTADCCN